MRRKKEIGWFILLAVLCLPLIVFLKEQDPITQLNQQLEGLLVQNQQQPNPATSKKIQQLKAQTVQYVAQHGQKATIIAAPQELIPVMDLSDMDKMLAGLANGDQIKIFEYHHNGAFVIMTSNGVKGYLLHTKLEPAVSDFPLNILIEKTGVAPKEFATKAEEAPTKNTETVVEKASLQPLVPVPSKSTSNPHQKSKSVRCTAITQKGRQCKRRTRYANQRCWQHQ